MMRGLWLIGSSLFLIWVGFLIFGGGDSDELPAYNDIATFTPKVSEDENWARNVCDFRFEQEVGGPVEKHYEVKLVSAGTYLVTIVWYDMGEGNASKCEVKDRKIVKFEE